jgi:hypothetical protein
MNDRCCWSNCKNPAGSGTYTTIEVPQIGTTPMTATMPVCEEHWFGNWVAERHRLRAEVAGLRQVLESVLAQVSTIAAPVSPPDRVTLDEMGIGR